MSLVMGKLSGITPPPSPFPLPFPSHFHFSNYLQSFKFIWNAFFTRKLNFFYFPLNVVLGSLLTFFYVATFTLIKFLFSLPNIPLLAPIMILRLDGNSEYVAHVRKKISLFRIKYQILDCCWSNEMPSTGQITEIAPHARIYF